MFFLVPILMALIGYVVMKALIFDMADEVSDAGDALIVRYGKQEERIALSNIAKVRAFRFMNPPRVTLELKQPGAFGPKVAFCGPLQFLPFSVGPEIEDLMRRVEATRRT